ncbi:MAG: hypothetical protein MZW92_51435 [Comamonadaceae bacterium]|nr:hypothetical protein [Comamonadaceae bacterium]
MAMSRSGEIGRHRRRTAASASATRSRTAPRCTVERRRHGQGRPGRRRAGTRTPARSSPRWRARCSSRTSIEGVTVAKQVDEVTGLSTLRGHRPEAARRGGKDLRPAIKLVERHGQGGQARRHRHPGDYTLPGRRASSSVRRRPAGGGRRRAGAHPAGDRRRPATSPAVCRAWPSCSRRARPRTPAMLAEITGTVSLRQGRPRASSA